MLTSQILLWVAVVVLALLVAALARQVGILHERIAPAGALTLHQHVEVGEKPTSLELKAVGGGSVTIGGARQGRSQLVFFAAPDCPMCKSLLPVLKSSARAEADWLDVVLADPSATDDLDELEAACQRVGATLVLAPMSARDRVGVHDRLRLAAALQDIMAQPPTTPRGVAG